MDDADGLSVQKPTSLQLRHSNNSMIDKAVVVQPPLKTSNAEEHVEKDELGDEIKASVNQTCAMFGQIVENDDTWDLLSDAASWESSFPKEILSDHCSPTSESETENLPQGWKKISDSAGSYYWNIETGKTQANLPAGDSATEDSENFDASTETSDSAFLDDDAKTDKPALLPNTPRDGHMFVVRSLGWLPLEHENLKPDISSAAVNSCIRLLSNNRSQIMDGVGVWGEGKDLMLLITSNLLKIVDPLENTVLQSQPIKHIRIWGVGRDSSHDFAYVVRDPSTKMYKCHVLRCETPAHAIAKQLHTVCSFLVQQKKHAENDSTENTQSDKIPVPTCESCQTFHTRYIGSIKVSKPSGIEVLKAAMSQLMRDTNSLTKDVKVTVSSSSLVVYDSDNIAIVNCRMRYMSFMGVGDDIQLFGFIGVIGGEATCYVLQCVPNAAKIALAVQEACMLRYQKAIDSNQTVKTESEQQHNTKSLKSKFMKVFSGWRHGKS